MTSLSHLGAALALAIAGACRTTTLGVRPGDDLAAAVAEPGRAT